MPGPSSGDLSRCSQLQRREEHGGADPNDCREAIEEMIAEIKVGYDNMVQAVGNGNVNHKAVRAAMARKMPSDAEDSEEESTDELEQEKALKRKALKALKAEKQKNDKLSETFAQKKPAVR